MQLSTAHFREFLYSSGNTKMSIPQIVSHTSKICTISEFDEVKASLEKIKLNLEKNRSTHILKKIFTVFLSSLLNLCRGFGFKDSLTLITEALAKVNNEEDKISSSDIESKILSGKFHELIEFFNSRPEQLIKNRALIQKHLELKTLNLEMEGLLPLLLDKFLIKDPTALNGLSEEVLSKLSKTQILRLCALFSKSEVRLEMPPYAKNFMQILQLPKEQIFEQPDGLSQGIQNVRGLAGITEEDKDAAIALYIEHYTISLVFIKKNMTEEEFLRLAPHLRHVDLKYFYDIPLAQKFLEKCSNLKELLVYNEKMLEGVNALPLCEKLVCQECKDLQTLPALPLCKELDCRSCTELQALPALPLCKELWCHDCIKLQALPALPLCELLGCAGCTKLESLPALPRCRQLSCWDCPILLALPALPRCEKLYCRNCTRLTELPALPLCREVFCNGCTCLQALPSLPRCVVLNCSSCRWLQELPALPLCEQLFFCGCTRLTTLPLSLGQNPDLMDIDILGTSIHPDIRDAILDQCRLMRDAEAVKILPTRIAKWKAIAKSDHGLDVSALSETQKKTLNEWLHRLERTQDFAIEQSLLAGTVCNILADLLKNKEFQELFFPQADANNACCEDRASMSLNEIFTSWKIICTPVSLPLKEKLKVMTGVAKTLRLRKALQKLVKDEGESVEIFLYYESTLRKRLDLVTAIQNMTYSTIGKRDWIDKEKLVQDVQSHFFEELFELPVFEKMVKQQWEKIDLEFSGKLEQLGDCPIGGQDEENVLNYQHRQGQIMQEWKRKKMQAAKQWYEKWIA